MSTQADLGKLYQVHIQQLVSDYQTLLAEYGFDHLVIGSGEQEYYYLDDIPVFFRSNPQFAAVVPLVRHPNCYIVIPLQGKPSVIYFQPFDYWHVVPSAPAGIWVEHFNVVIVRTPDEALAALPKDLRNTAYIGKVTQRVSPLVFAAVNPNALINELHWRRAYKSEYEVACLLEANRIAARAHYAARDAFYAGASEMDIHYSYVKACGVLEAEMAYGNIIAINEHSACLHYTEMQTHSVPAAERRSFLIDAGALFNGYAADITRTYAYHQQGEYAELVKAMDEIELDIIAHIKPGDDYADLHRYAHLKIAEILARFDFVKMSAESIVETHISNTFFPHGLGHFLGIQVHDIGGRQTTPKGGFTPPPAPYIYLRDTRRIEKHQVFTIEPGLYFIEMLLKEWHTGAHKKAFNWEKIESFKPYGGVRVEDDVLVGDKGVRNLSREAFAELK